MADGLDAKVVRTSPVLWILGAVFAGFLGSLGTKVLMDVAAVFREPDASQFRGADLRETEAKRVAVAQSTDPRREKLARAERDLAALDRAVNTGESSFHNWLDARATLGREGDEDREVRARRDRLDRLREERDQAAAAVEKTRLLPDERSQQLRDLDASISAEQRKADDAWAAAHRAWTFKVLAARLSLVIPLWALAAWLWSRRHRSRYPTLLWGYWAFAVWMLVYGVGPFLPHYGGYAPLIIGIAATVYGSISLVRYFNRRAPLRRQRLVATAIARHRCPGCERDYLLGREVSMDQGPGRRGSLRHYDAAALRPRTCPSCGLELFGPCPGCKTDQLLLLDRCPSCGVERRPAVSGFEPSNAPAV
jgi:hypothetical protein